MTSWISTVLWCLNGGLAVNCYVEPVFTIDADIVVALDDLRSIQVELIARGFEVTEPSHSVNAQMAGSELRIQFTVVQRYQKFLVDTSVKLVLGERVHVASLENIGRGRVWAWTDPKQRLSRRKKDELDLISVAEKYPELRTLMPPVINEQLNRSANCQFAFWNTTRNPNRLRYKERHSLCQP